MEWKNLGIMAQYNDLHRKSPPLLAVLLYADYLAHKLFGKHVTITSLYRRDDSPHSKDLAADCRILNLTRDLRPDSELSLDEWITIRPLVNQAFVAKPHVIRIVIVEDDKQTPEDESTHTHVHAQIPRVEGWQ